MNLDERISQCKTDIETLTKELKKLQNQKKIVPVSGMVLKTRGDPGPFTLLRNGEGWYLTWVQCGRIKYRSYGEGTAEKCLNNGTWILLENKNE